MPTQRGRTSSAADGVRDGMERDGIGTPGLALTRSFRPTAPSSGRSAGASTRLGSCTGRRTSVTATAITAASGMDTSIVRSGRGIGRQSPREIGVDSRRLEADLAAVLLAGPEADLVAVPVGSAASEADAGNSSLHSDRCKWADQVPGSIEFHGNRL